MNEPVIVCGRLLRPEVLDHLNQLAAVQPPCSGNALARETCSLLAWYSPNGRPALSSAKVALRKLRRRGVLAPRKEGRKKSHRLRSSGQKLPLVARVPARVDLVQGLHLHLLIGQEDPLHLLWNDLIIAQHPCGDAPLVGAQLRYLIGSDHGWLGALGFGPAAFVLSCRDQWIGWTTASRLGHPASAGLGSHGGLARPGECEAGKNPAATAGQRIILDRRTGSLAGRDAKKKPRLNAAATMTLSEANRRVARLGGYMARKGDGEPGAESLGLGLRRLTDLTWGWRLRRQAKQAAR